MQEQVIRHASHYRGYRRNEVTHANIGLVRMTLSPTAIQLLGMLADKWNRVYVLPATTGKENEFAGEMKNGTHGLVRF